MDNTRIINLTVKFKSRLRSEIEENKYNSATMQEWLWKTLIMTEVAHRSLSLETKIEQAEKHYFNCQASVGRFFCDWKMDWVAEYFNEISNYIAAYYWPDNDKKWLPDDYTPFATFKLEE